MSPDISNLLVTTLPQVTLSILFMIGLYLAARFLTRQYREQREEIGVQVNDAISTRIAERLGKIQEESEKATKVREAIERKAQEVTEEIAKRKASLTAAQQDLEGRMAELSRQMEERSEQSETQFNDLTCKLTQLGAYVPFVTHEIDAQQIRRLQTSKDWAVVGEIVAKIMASTECPSSFLEIAGDAARDNQRLQLAEDLYLRAWNKDMENLSARMEYLCLIAEKDYARRDECLAEAQEIVTERHVPGRVLGRLSNALFRLDRYEQVQEVSEAILSRRKASSNDKDRELVNQARRDLAVALQSQGRLEEAEEQLMIAIKEVPEDENVVHALLNFQLERGDYGRALAAAKKLLLLDPLDFRYYLRIVEILEHKEDYEGAVQWIERAKELAPEGLEPQLEDMKKKNIRRRELSRIENFGAGELALDQVAARLDQGLQIMQASAAA